MGKILHLILNTTVKARWSYKKQLQILEKQIQLSFQSATEIRKQVIRGKQSPPLLWPHFLHPAGSQAGGSAAVLLPVVTGWIPRLEHLFGDPGSVMHSDL